MLSAPDYLVERPALRQEGHVYGPECVMNAPSVRRAMLVVEMIRVLDSTLPS